jgi:homoserine kinase
MPASAALVDELRAAGFAATVSGAGPTVLVLAAADQTPDPAAWAPAGWHGRRLELDTRGAMVVG